MKTIQQKENDFGIEVEIKIIKALKRRTILRVLLYQIISYIPVLLSFDILRSVYLNLDYLYIGIKISNMPTSTLSNILVVNLITYCFLYYKSYKIWMLNGGL